MRIAALMIPLAFSPWTFDHFGTPKMVVFLLFIPFLLGMVWRNRSHLTSLPVFILYSGAFFVLIHLFQAGRSFPQIEIFFGSYGQSESLLVTLGLFLFFLAAAMVLGHNAARRKLYETLFVAAFFTSIYACCQYFVEDPLTTARLHRVESLFGDPNSLAIFLVLCIPLLLWLFRTETVVWRKVFLWSGIFISLVALVLTFSRTGWLGLSASLLLIIGIGGCRWQQNKHFLLFMVVTVSLSILTGMGLVQLHPEPAADYRVVERLASIPAGQDSGRSLIWSVAWRIFFDSPIFGHGTGSLVYTFHRFQNQAAVAFWGADRDIRQTHNEYLHILATQGMVGLIAWLGFLAAIGYYGVRFVDKDNLLGSDRLFILAACVGYLICMGLAYPLIHYSFLFWIYLGILAGTRQPALTPLHKRPPLSVHYFIALLLTGLWTILPLRILQADIDYQKGFKQGKRLQYAAALTNYKKAVVLTPWVYQYRHRYALILYRAARREKDPVRLRSALDSAYQEALSVHRAFPEQYRTLFLLGRIAEHGQFENIAVQHYLKTLGLYPNNYLVYARLAGIHVRAGRINEARQALMKGLSIAPKQMAAVIQSDLSLSKLLK